MPKSIQQFCINLASIFPIAPFGVHSRALQGVFLLALFLIIIKCSRNNVHVTSEQSMLLQKMGQLEDPWSSLPQGALNDRRDFLLISNNGSFGWQPTATQGKFQFNQTAKEQGSITFFFCQSCVISFDVLSTEN